ncbi:MAG: hypothetical protein QGF67_01530 [Lentisphaeria bacterium]|nr:hypothetical protein [Lentisphaeria bacterium]MDP7740093.1 hypothetical protein [Lentisphaeria bacterium]
MLPSQPRRRGAEAGFSLVRQQLFRDPCDTVRARAGPDAGLAVPLGPVAPGKLTKWRPPDSVQTALAAAAGVEALTAAIGEAVTITLPSGPISCRQLAP